MSRTTTPLPLMGKLHPLTGEPIRAIGFRKNGRPIFPIMGAAEDPPTKPEDLPQETWDALGDPGKAALVSERSARQQAEQRAATAERERDAARARPTPPKNTPPTPTPPAPTGDKPDIAAIVQQAVQAAIAPFQERETQRDTERAAGLVRDAVVEAAKAVLHDPTDALGNVDLTTVVDDQGRVDPAKVKTALEQVVASKPHLAKSTTRQAPFGIGGGAPANAGSEGERVKALLAQMQASAGVRTAPPPPDHSP